MKNKSSKQKGLEGEKTAIRMLCKYFSYENIGKTIGSGCFWHSKGDWNIRHINGDNYLVEIKTTEKNKFRINSKLIEKIWYEALEENKLPLFLVLLETKNNNKLLLIDIFARNIDKCNKYLKGFLIKETFIDDLIENNNTPHILIGDNDNKWQLNMKAIKESK